MGLVDQRSTFDVSAYGPLLRIGGNSRDFDGKSRNRGIERGHRIDALISFGDLALAPSV
jgi:hypothetical protein